MKLDFDKDTSISDDLPNEWLRQSTLVYNYNKELSIAIKKRDKIKLDLDVTKSTLEKSIRKDPSIVDLIKVTDSSVTTAILRQPEYLEVLNKKINIDYEINILKGALSSLEHKKKALEEQDKFLFSGFFGDPIHSDIVPKDERLDEKLINEVSKAQRARPGRKKRKIKGG